MVSAGNRLARQRAVFLGQKSGRSAAWLARLLGVQEVSGSNPLGPIIFLSESSRTTHGAPECVESCQLLAAMICGALSGASKDEVLFSHDLSTFQSAKFVELQRLLPRERASELGRSAPVRSR